MTETRTDYASVQDVITLWRTLTEAEITRVEALLPVISDELRNQARMVNRDLDEMILENPYLANVAKEVTVSVISRILRQSNLKRLGLKRPRIGIIDFYDPSNRKR